MGRPKKFEEDLNGSNGQLGSKVAEVPVWPQRKQVSQQHVNRRLAAKRCRGDGGQLETVAPPLMGGGAAAASMARAPAPGEAASVPLDATDLEEGQARMAAEVHRRRCRQLRLLPSLWRKAAAEGRLRRRRDNWQRLRRSPTFRPTCSRAISRSLCPQTCATTPLAC